MDSVVCFSTMTSSSMLPELELFRLRRLLFCLDSTTCVSIGLLWRLTFECLWLLLPTLSELEAH